MKTSTILLALSVMLYTVVMLHFRDAAHPWPFLLMLSHILIIIGLVVAYEEDER